MATARLVIQPPTDDLPIGSAAFLSTRSVFHVRSRPLAAEHTPAPQTKPFQVWGSLLVGVAALLFVGLALWVINQLLPDSHYDNLKAATLGGAAAAGTLSMFATFYVAAQAIERLLEPLSNALLNKDAVEGTYASKVDDAMKKAKDLADAASAESPNAAQIADKKKAAETALKDVADAKNKVDFLSQARTALFWSLATVAGMAASAALKLYFLVLVGISPAPRWMEVLATGLIIGSGTKPLHDLLSTISEKKDAATAGSAVADVGASG
jgi:hypothetical protein